MAQQAKVSYLARGFFPVLGAAELAAPPPNSLPVKLGDGTTYDISPFLQAQLELGSMVTQFARNPYDVQPLLRLQNFSRQLQPALRVAATSNPVLRATAAPMALALQSYAANAQKLVGMRMRTAYHINRAPKILVPIPVSIVSGATLTQVQIRNPYFGSIGGLGNLYQAPWTITSFRTGNGEDGGLRPIRITQFLLGGHDYVAASLGGLTYAAGGAPAVLGWPAASFAETKRGNWKTEIQPWASIAQGPGGGTGFGSIMSEVGFLQIGVFNGGAQTYVDTWAVYCNASLCGNPFGDSRFTQVQTFRDSFAPLALQAPLAMRLAGDSNGWAGQIINTEAPNLPELGPWMWAQKMANMGSSLQSLMDSPPPGIAMGDDFDIDMPLDGDARYVG